MGVVTGTSGCGKNGESVRAEIFCPKKVGHD